MVSWWVMDASAITEVVISSNRVAGVVPFRCLDRPKIAL